MRTLNLQTQLLSPSWRLELKRGTNPRLHLPHGTEAPPPAVALTFLPQPVPNLCIYITIVSIVCSTVPAASQIWWTGQSRIAPPPSHSPTTATCSVPGNSTIKQPMPESHRLSVVRSISHTAAEKDVNRNGASLITSHSSPRMQPAITTSWNSYRLGIQRASIASPASTWTSYADTGTGSSHSQGVYKDRYRNSSPQIDATKRFKVSRR